MTEQEQNTQKTIVAFVAGLLVGGLLVWVFSAPTDSPKEESSEHDALVEVNNEESSDASGEVTFKEKETSSDNSSEVVSIAVDMEVGDGEISISNQEAGKTVELNSAVFPGDEGWIGIRDYQNDTLGNILGVARFSKEQGLIPNEVSLVRATVAGNTYAAVFFTESGDREFSLADDSQIDSVLTVFTAK